MMTRVVITLGIIIYIILFFLFIFILLLLVMVLLLSYYFHINYSAFCCPIIISTNRRNLLIIDRCWLLWKKIR